MPLNPDSLESATGKAAWLDEAGQRGFKCKASRPSAEGCRSIRAACSSPPRPTTWAGSFSSSSSRGWRRAGTIRTSTSSSSNRWRTRCSTLASTMPAPSMPGSRFRMFYDGEFDRPAGLIYDCFDPLLMSLPQFRLKDSWKRYLGLDFGSIHTAAVFLAEEPITGRLFAYREYLPGVTGQGTRRALARRRTGPADGRRRQRLGTAVARSFGAAGCRSRNRPCATSPWASAASTAPSSRTASACWPAVRGCDELDTYSSKSMSGRASEDIQDKSDYHLLDSLRYIVSHLRQWGTGAFTVKADPRA